MEFVNGEPRFSVEMVDGGGMFEPGGAKAVKKHGPSKSGYIHYMKDYPEVS